MKVLRAPVTLQVGAYRRKVLLPRSLAGCPVLGARFAEQRLRIRFGERPVAPAAAKEE